jgi:hypothetical protein
VNDINLLTWFGQRQLKFCPKHFIKTSATVTDEAHEWILERLSGRFFIMNASHASLFFNDKQAYFEDPKEATLFELTWS